ncbi:MAG: hypothetical protein ABSE56_08395 [Bryobacteraceae bacterium]|jgi:Cu/Zn superoxide dismutase
MIARIGAALAVLAMALAARTTQPNMQPLKEQRGLCQAAVPADATVLAGYIAQGPKEAYTAQLEEFHYSRAFENTATRLWVETEAHALSPGIRAFHVYVPAKTGRCHLGISFKTTTPDDAPKRIAQTLSAVK